MKPLRGVIFDFGNTLIRLDPKLRSKRVDYADVLARPCAERLAEFLARDGILPREEGGRETFIDRFLDVRERNRGRAETTGREISATMSLEQTMREIGIAVPGLDRLERAIEAHFGPEVEAIVPMPGAPETLDALVGRGVRVAVLSNATSGPYVARVAEGFGWTRHFDIFAVSADIGVRKPWPEAFHAVLDRWPFAPEEVAMVGDSLYHDVQGAAALGLVTVHLNAIENPYDPPYRASVHPALSAASHEELRRSLLPVCV